jgi:hypothetical protein
VDINNVELVESVLLPLYHRPLSPLLSSKSWLASSTAVRCQANGLRWGFPQFSQRSLQLCRIQLTASCWSGLDSTSEFRTSAGRG